MKITYSQEFIALIFPIHNTFLKYSVLSVTTLINARSGLIKDMVKICL